MFFFSRVYGRSSKYWISSTVLALGVGRAHPPSQFCKSLFRFVDGFFMKGPRGGAVFGSIGCS